MEQDIDMQALSAAIAGFLACHVLTCRFLVQEGVVEKDRFTAYLETAMADFLGLMKQAAELKSKMEAMQAELDQMEVEGTSGGGLVTVKLSGKGEVKGVKIDDTLMQPSEKEILEDLIVAAYADARRKAETLLQDKMKSVAGGLPLPPGMKLF